MKLRAFLIAIGFTLVTTACGYVHGSVEVVGPPQPGFYFSVGVKAVSGIGGTAAAYQPGGHIMSGRVTCLAVSGRRATIGVRNDDYPDAQAGGLIFVEDNGTPGAGVDIVNAEYVDVVPRTCVPPTDEQLDVFPQFPGLERVYSGDVVVGVLGVTATTLGRPAHDPAETSRS